MKTVSMCYLHCVLYNSRPPHCHHATTAVRQPCAASKCKFLLNVSSNATRLWYTYKQGKDSLTVISFFPPFRALLTKATSLFFLLSAVCWPIFLSGLLCQNFEENTTLFLNYIPIVLAFWAEGTTYYLLVVTKDVRSCASLYCNGMTKSS